MADASLRERLRAALTSAMKARDTAAVGALRSALGAIDNAGAVAPEPILTTTDGPIAGARAGLGAAETTRLELSEDEVAAVVGTEIDERLEAAALFERAGKADRAEALRAEAAVLSAHLS